MLSLVLSTIDDAAASGICANGGAARSAVTASSTGSSGAGSPSHASFPALLTYALINWCSRKVGDDVGTFNDDNDDLQAASIKANEAAIQRSRNSNPIQQLGGDIRQVGLHVIKGLGGAAALYCLLILPEVQARLRPPVVRLGPLRPQCCGYLCILSGLQEPEFQVCSSTPSARYEKCSPPVCTASA